jgi:hypothetical protein
MFFYLGEKVTTVDSKTRLARNKAKSWAYGYDKSIDTIIISTDGTLGEVYRVSGVNIGLPAQPDKKNILNWDKTDKNQKWERKGLPEGLNVNTAGLPKYQQYLEEENRRRDEGLWIYLNGKPVYLARSYYFFIQWIREEEKYPALRIIQNELMLFWEACKADDRCYGMDYVKNRRFGASALGLCELTEAGTTVENKILGMISKKGNDAKKIFNRMVRSFKRLPFFFMPVWDGTTTPKTELILDEPTKKRKAGEEISEGDGLGTIISWHNTELNAMDGEKIYRSLIDEAGKWPKDVPFSEYWSIVKTSHRIGSNIVGKAFVVSTVNAMKKGGAEFKKIWDDSDANERNKNDQTKSGLYRIFIPAEYCLEGFFDVYGFSIVADPEEPVLNDLGKYTSIGAVTFLDNELEMLKDDPEKYNEFQRQFPRSERDAFRDEATDCEFNLMKLNQQIDHNEFDMLPDEVERGNFSWVDGVRFGQVKWNPNPEGRFWIAKGCHPPEEFRNKKEMKYINGVTAWAPLAGHIGCFGVDPYNRSKTVDNRGSRGAIHLSTKDNPSELPNRAFILEYIDRPRRVEDFFEDVLMAMIYYSMPMLCELSNEKFLSWIKENGFRHFSMNNPLKLYKDLNPTEKELGGAPPQDSKIGDQQFYVTESYIEDMIGIAMEGNNRPIGEMGFMPFTRTLLQWKEVDASARTKYDAYISSSLSLLGNQKLALKVKAKKRRFMPFQMFKNTGLVSERYNPGDDD